MASALALALVALALARECACANVLALLSTPTRSHHIWVSPLVEALAARGHNLTVLSPSALSPPNPNVTDLVIEGALRHIDQQSDYVANAALSPLQWIPATFEWYLQACNYTLHTEGVRRLHAYPPDFRFDLVIIEATGGECLLGFVEKFGRPPLVAVNGFGHPHWVSWNAGSPDNPAYISNFQLTLHHPFSLLEKLYNVAMYACTLAYYRLSYLPANDALIQRHFPSHAAAAGGAEATLRNASVVLVNAHYSVDGARPLVPALVPVGGMHIRPPKPLPQDLQAFLDGARGGAVLFSLGSVVRSERLGAAQVAEIAAALAALGPRGARALWKWEADAPPVPALPPHVRVAKWLPQGDVLAHPNVRVFVSHAGLLSTHEAVWRGVPVVAMPFVVDQWLNAGRLQALGVATRLDYARLTRDALLAAITDVLTDPGYGRRMRELSAVFRARAVAPLDEAVFWTEHALRHGGAPRLRSPSAALPWHALRLLDVALALLLLLLAPLLALFACCRLALRRRRPATKDKDE